MTEVRRRSDSRLRVAEVFFDGFRGAAGPSTVSFLDKNGQASSVVLFGENGTGKSTMVDALEFACQGTVGRTKAWRSPQRPAVWNAGATSDAIARVTFATGASIERTLSRRSPHESEKLTTSKQGHIPEMRFAPIALKRSDVTRFMETPSTERGMLLTDYFARSLSATLRGKFEGWSTADLKELRDRQNALRDEMRNRAEIMSGLLSLPNRQPQYVLAQIKFRVFNGTIPREWEDFPDRQAIRDDIYEGSLALRDVDAEFRNVGAEITTAVKALSRRKDRIPYEFRRTASALADMLLNVSQELTDSFIAITGASHVAAIWAEFGRTETTSLDLFVRLQNGKTYSPHQIFSEGYLDLFALLFLLALAQEAAKHGQLRVIALDDVFQSVDASIRAQMMHYIMNRFQDWQLIVTVHDRLWRQ
jgi:hypothetical protein